MNAPFKVRYVLISDYGTVDHAGKLVIAGLYTEDMVVPALPALFNSLVFTVVAETPKASRTYQFAVENPNGHPVFGGNGRLDPDVTRKGARPRSVIGFQFNNIFLREAGDYNVVISDSDGSNRTTVHQFRLVVDPAIAPADGPPGSQSRG